MGGVERAMLGQGRNELLICRGLGLGDAWGMGGRHLPGAPSRLQGQQDLGLHFGQEVQCPLLGLQDHAPQGSPENSGEGSGIIAAVVILIYWRVFKQSGPELGGYQHIQSIPPDSSQRAL